MINSQTINKQETAVKQIRTQIFSDKAFALVDIRHFKQHHTTNKENIYARKRSTPLVQSQTKTHPIKSYLRKNNVLC